MTNKLFYVTGPFACQCLSVRPTDTPTVALLFVTGRVSPLPRVRPMAPHIGGVLIMEASFCYKKAPKLCLLGKKSMLMTND